MTMTTTKGRLRTRSKFALIDSKGTTEPRQVHEEQKSVTPLLLLVRLLFHHLGTGSGGAAATATSPETGFHVLRKLGVVTQLLVCMIVLTNNNPICPVVISDDHVEILKIDSEGS